MKVIKEGKKIVGVMEVTCKKCEAELEIMADDINVKDGVGFDPVSYRYECPCCHRQNYLSYNELTEEILFDIRNK